MSPTTSKFSSGVLMLAAAGPVAFGAFGLLIGLGASPMREWFWTSPDTNIVEAAALGDAARVRTLAAAGVSLDAPVRVRPDLLDDNLPPQMSALEAAVRRRSDSLVQMVIELGARPSDQEARRLACLAREVDDPGTAAVLDRAFAIPAEACAAQDRQGQPSASKE
jgi:hypothetical protein